MKGRSFKKDIILRNIQQGWSFTASLRGFQEPLGLALKLAKIIISITECLIQEYSEKSLNVSEHLVPAFTL